MASTSGILKLHKAIEALRAIDPEMQGNVMQAFLIVALTKEEGISHQDLAKQVGVSQSAISRNVGMLSAWTPYKETGPGLVDSVSDPMNMRQKIVRLTPKGRKFSETLTTIMA